MTTISEQSLAPATGPAAYPKSASTSLVASVLAAGLLLSACTPRVVVEAPSDPITINLNVKIDQEVRVKLDQEVEDLIADNPDLF